MLSDVYYTRASTEQVSAACVKEVLRAFGQGSYSYWRLREDTLGSVTWSTIAFLSELLGLSIRGNSAKDRSRLAFIIYPDLTVNPVLGHRGTPLRA